MFNKNVVTYSVNNVGIEGYQVGYNFFHYLSQCYHYKVSPGETYRSIAQKVYGDADKWYNIANMNLKPFFPMELKGGEDIIIPLLEEEY